MNGSAARWGALAAALLGGAGCGVPLGAAEGISPINICSSSAECAEGSTCASGACVATTYDLTGLVLEVRPLAGASLGTSTPYFLDPAAAGVSLTSHRSEEVPFIAGFDAKLPAQVSIQNGLVLLDPSTSCGASGQGIPANLTFYPIGPFAGPTLDPVTVTATGPGGAPPFTYSVDLVPGAYDVYIEPQPIKGCNGDHAYPPVFLPGQIINTGGASPWTLPPVGTLTGTISGLSAVDKWKVSLVEHSRGLPISSGGTLTAGNGGATVSAQISWSDTSLAPILRLTPNDPAQAGSPQPSVYWSLPGAVFNGTQTNPVVSFAVDGLLVSGVTVTGQILDLDGITGAPSLLTFQSQSLFGANAGNAAFSLSNWPTSPDGTFTVPLPPGDYRIRAVPQSNDALSVSDFLLSWPSTWTSSDKCVCGQTFTLQAKASLQDTITTPTGQALAGTFVGLVPSLSPPRLFLASTHTLDPVATRVVSSRTDAAGHFSLRGDLGTSDLMVEPDPGTRYPWLVRPDMSITMGLSPPMLALKNPVFLSGSLVDPHGMPVADAEINAWFPLRSPSATNGLTGTAVKIATTSTDAKGAFSLVMPSSL